MSTLPPNPRGDMSRSTSVNMAVAQPVKSKATSKPNNNASQKAKAQMHRRSRTGVYFLHLHAVHLHRAAPWPCLYMTWETKLEC